MTKTGRPKAVLELTEGEREQLVWWEQRKSCQALALRSRSVLQYASGLSNTQVAEAVGVTALTVGKTRSRFCELRLDWLSDDPRPGRPASITTDQVAEVLVATLESTPENATHRTRASMAKRSGRSNSTIVTDDLLHRSDHRSVPALENDIRNRVKAWNEDPKRFMLTKSAEEIPASLDLRTLVP